MSFFSSSAPTGANFLADLGLKVGFRLEAASCLERGRGQWSSTGEVDLSKRVLEDTSPSPDEEAVSRRTVATASAKTTNNTNGASGFRRRIFRHTCSCIFIDEFSLRVLVLCHSARPRPLATHECGCRPANQQCLAARPAT